MSQLKLLQEAIANEIQGFAMIPKSSSRLQRFISKILFFNPKYMSHYTTTIYPRVYLADTLVEAEDNQKFSVLAHEFVHLYDAQDNNIKFSALYLIPQILSLVGLLSILAIWQPPFAVFAIFFGFLLPLPAHYRKYYELRGYSMKMCMELWYNGYIDPNTKRFIKSQFTSSAYYYMWPFQADLDLEIIHIEKSIRSGKILEGKEGKPFRVVKEVMKQSSTYRWAKD